MHIVNIGRDSLPFTIQLGMILGKVKKNFDKYKKISVKFVDIGKLFVQRIKFALLLFISKKRLLESLPPMLF